MTKQGSKKTVLITGSGGLLGTELIEQLLDGDNWQVIAMTSNVNNVVNKFNNDKLLVVSNDSWIEQLSNRNIKVDILINCAFPRSSKPEELAQGIPFTERIITDSIDFGIENIINISTQSVYTQKQKEDVTEKSAVQPESLYGMTKYACERVVSILCETNNVKYSNIRLGSLTGLNFDVRMTNRFVKSVINGEKIVINGGEQKLSYLDVRDAANGLIKMLSSNPNNWKPIYNLGNQQVFTLLELIDVIKMKAKDYEYDNPEIEVNHGDSNYNNVMNNDLFYDQFTFEHKFDLNKMIDELFKQRLSED